MVSKRERHREGSGHEERWMRAENQLDGDMSEGEDAGV